MQKLLGAVFLFLIPITILAQYQELPPTHGNEYGAGFTVAMSGFGFGGFYRFALPNYFHIGVDFDFYMMRDDKEYSFYDPYFDYYFEVNKLNRLFIIPINLELKKRLFADSIEDSFRPYIIGLAGFTFGMNFPKKENYPYAELGGVDISSLPQHNEYRFTLNFAIGIGVDFSTNDNFYFSIRPQYRFIHFAEPIASKKNHSTFEIRFELGTRKL